MSSRGYDMLSTTQSHNPQVMEGDQDNVWSCHIRCRPNRKDPLGNLVKQTGVKLKYVVDVHAPSAAPAMEQSNKSSGIHMVLPMWERSMIGALT